MYDGSLPGGPRNGLPEARPYVCKGLGYDTLTGPSQMAQEARERRRNRPASSVRPVTSPEPAPAPPPEPERCGTCGYLLTAPGHKLACGSGAG
jgi:hypothetical protein